MTQFQAGWYPDPSSPEGSGVMRWYDGSAWTSQVHRKRSALVATAARTSATTRQPAAPAMARSVRRPTPRTAQSPPDQTGSWDSIPQPGTTYTPEWFFPAHSQGRRFRRLLLVAFGITVLWYAARTFS